MIKNTDEILAKRIREAEDIVKGLTENMIKQEKEGKLTIDTTKKLLGFAINRFMQIVTDMSGQLLSNVEVEKKRK